MKIKGDKEKKNAVSKISLKYQKKKKFIKVVIQKWILHVKKKKKFKSVIIPILLFRVLYIFFLKRLSIASAMPIMLIVNAVSIFYI